MLPEVDKIWSELWNPVP